MQFYLSPQGDAAEAALGYRASDHVNETCFCVWFGKPVAIADVYDAISKTAHIPPAGAPLCVAFMRRKDKQPFLHLYFQGGAVRSWVGKDKHAQRIIAKYGFSRAPGVPSGFLLVTVQRLNKTSGTCLVTDENGSPHSCGWQETLARRGEVVTDIHNVVGDADLLRGVLGLWMGAEDTFSVTRAQLRKAPRVR